MSDLLICQGVLLSPGNGPGARPMEMEWAREIVRQCRWSAIAPFVKQLGSVAGRELGAGPKGGDWDAWPRDLRVREFPGPAAASPLGVTGARP
jgi:protein gp37